MDDADITIEDLRDDIEAWALDKRAKRVAYARKYWAFGAALNIVPNGERVINGAGDARVVNGTGDQRVIA